MSADARTGAASESTVIRAHATHDNAPRDDVAEPAPERAIVVCDQWLGSNGYAGMKALRRAGWSVTVVPEWEFVPVRWRRSGMRALGRAIRRAAVAEFTAELLRQADRVRPEFLLVFKGTFVSAEAIQELQARGVRSYCFFPDVSFRAHGSLLPRALPRYDWVFSTKTFGLRDMREQLGITRASLLLHAYDADLHRPVPLSDWDRARYSCDVSFIGTWSPKKEESLAELHRQRPNLRMRIWGEQWDRASSPALRSAIAGHEIPGEEYVRAIRASTINLGLLSERRAGASGDDRITSRTFHIPACGGFMLHERTDELLTHFVEDRSVACYDGVDQLVQRVDQYLADPDRRASISEAGLAVVRARHSWDHRIAEILSHHASDSPALPT